MENYVVVSVPENSAVEFVFDMFPNPVISEVTIEMPGEAELSLTDATGRAVLSASLKKGQNTVDVQSLAAGIYFATARVKHASKTIRLVKTN